MHCSCSSCRRKDQGTFENEHDRLYLVAHLPQHHLAVLAVAVALGLALAGPLLDVAHFLGLEGAVRLLLGLLEGVGELLHVGPDLGNIGSTWSEHRHTKLTVLGVL